MELHDRIEAMKLAYSDLYRYNADPRFAKVPVKGLLSEDYAKQRASQIDPEKANCTPASGSPARSDTTYLAAIDKDGNIVSLIQSLYDAFGSGVAVKDEASSCRIAADCSCLIPAIPMRWHPASGHFTPSFPHSWSRVTSTSDSASWAEPISRWLTPSLFRISWITE